MSKVHTSHVWIPCKEFIGHWHHYIVTTVRACAHMTDDHPGKCSISDVIRVAYERTLSGGRQMTCIVSDEADRAARWNLWPAAASAWVAQRANGWDGTLASLNQLATKEFRNV